MDVHSSAIACGMILDEGYVICIVCDVYCSVTSLSVGMGNGDGKKRGREERGRKTRGEHEHFGLALRLIFLVPGNIFYTFG